MYGPSSKDLIGIAFLIIIIGAILGACSFALIQFTVQHVHMTWR